MLAHLMLALAQSPGWEDVGLCYSEATDPCDVRVHPHWADLNLPGHQGGCDNGPFPEFGQIGTTLRLWTHRNRCEHDGDFLPEDTLVATVLATGFLSTPSFDPVAGYGYLDGTVIGTWWDVVEDEPIEQEGFAHVDIAIPDDPDLIGGVAFVQSLCFLPDDSIRESTAGRVELW